ncbi:MAG: hypothetical protein JWM09_1163 [Francisellaceae bacterium]|nr:hypothetical protein [Francisellaceae bacterium]
MSFAGLLVILVVALVVIKPEQIPQVARVLGLTLARLRHWIFKIEIESEQFLNSFNQPDFSENKTPSTPKPKTRKKNIKPDD